MDSLRIIERIENGELKFEEQFGAVTLRVELEAADSLGVLLKRVELTSTAKPAADVKAVLQKQAAGVIEGLAFLTELKLIEVDGVSNAVQIRSAKPSDGFLEIILRQGNSISIERRGPALHISKKDLARTINSGSDVLST